MTHQRSRHGRLAATASVAALVLLTIIPASIARGATELAIITRATGLQALTQVTNAGDGTNRLFLVEKRGTVRVFENGAVKPGYFLDLRSVVNDSAGERGLLGLAFHPAFETNRRLYVYYTRSDGDIVVARLRANDSGDSYLAKLACPDAKAPALVCPDEVVVADSLSDPSGEVVTFAVTADDDQDPAPSVVCVPPSGSSFPRGTTFVMCTATDGAGNQSTCQFPVTVRIKARRL